MPVIRIDLSEAYGALRQRRKALRRRRIMSWAVSGVVLAGLFAVIGVYYVSAVPLPEALNLPATTTVYYSDGKTVMARLGAQNRIEVKLSDLPAYVPAAVVASVDPSFYGDSGARISRQYARAATGLAGTSYLDRARALVLGWKLEDTYSKQEILEFYLNTVYFGRNAYGIGAAAEVYFRKPAAQLSLAEAAVLAGVLGAPGDGRYDPTVNASGAQQRFTEVVAQMASNGAISRAQADAARLPRVEAYDRSAFDSGLEAPTGLVVEQVLAELRQAPPFAGKPAGAIENGGYSIVTTIDTGVQRVVEQTADPGVPGSVLAAQPSNLQAAAVVVQPGTGAVLAYYGGGDGTGADFAGVHRTASGEFAGFGAHPAGQTFQVYTLAAALSAGISVESRWQAPPNREFPGSGLPPGTQVRDVLPADCQPVCTLAQATAASLSVPYFAVAEKVGVPKVLDTARQLGVTTLWLPETETTPRKRVELPPHADDVTPAAAANVALGAGAVTVLDQADAMATLAAGGVRAPAHFVASVTHGDDLVYKSSAASQRVFDPAVANQVTGLLAGNPAASLAGNRPAAAKDGVALLQGSAIETAHAWMVGYTPQLAVAIWVGNRETELPLRDDSGARITGSGLPAGIYRAVMDTSHSTLGLAPKAFPAPVYSGDATAGDAP
jgi:membrane peptidoglycan carboxypeptidase